MYIYIYIYMYMPAPFRFTLNWFAFSRSLFDSLSQSGNDNEPQLVLVGLLTGVSWHSGQTCRTSAWVKQQKFAVSLQASIHSQQVAWLSDSIFFSITSITTAACIHIRWCLKQVFLAQLIGATVTIYAGLQWSISWIVRHADGCPLPSR